jgi:copper chaperone CopZ
MKVRVLGIFAALAAVALFGVGSAFSKDDTKPADAKKADAKPAEAKKDCDDGCCEGDKKDAGTKTDGAKTDEKSCPKGEEGCEGCGKSTATFSKAIACADCAQSADGPCAKCKTALAEGKVAFVPIKGMSCSSCEGAVSAKLEKMDNVAKFMVNHRFNGAGIVVTPGKTLLLSEITKALVDSPKFSVDETVALRGKATLQLSGVADDADLASACNAVYKLLGVGCSSCGETSKACSNCKLDEKAKTATVTLTLGEKTSVSLKALRDALGAVKITDVAFFGAAIEPDKKS